MPPDGTNIQIEQNLTIITANFLKALEMRYATMVLHVQDGKLVHLEVTEKIKIK